MKKLTFLLLIALMPMMVGAQNAYKKAYEKAKKAEMTQSSTMTAEEMYKLGLNYYEGKNGKTQNYTEAVKWFRQAAEQGNAKAQTFMGVCCYNGSGVTQDYNEALKWYRKAAEQGYAIAQSNLGACYYNGKIVTRDYTEALKWYRKAAEQGHATAQYNVGNCYEYGNGVTKDKAEAMKWYRKAADNGYELAKKKLPEQNQSTTTASAQNSSSNSTLAQKTTNSTPTQKTTTSSATAQKRYHDVEFHNAKGKVKSIKTELSSGQSLSSMVEFTIDGKEKGATDVEYDNNGYRLSSKDISQTDGSTVTVKYTWKNDRVIKVFYSYYKNLSNTLNFTYNAKGEQIEVSDSGGFLKVQYSDYKYDARGNWISRKSSILAKSATETRTIVYY